jgi:hypothetical protein
MAVNLLQEAHGTLGGPYGKKLATTLVPPTGEASASRRSLPADG